ncbi:hypothetical protein ABL78_1704 [Leptomonas seymouri]|uniref:START domain-containing protein n=1 Tax=Leptomonas seymouri TaxID=5684 RepID=A0A0N1IM15_LEPSE|nr:hypothetical protein ABL78_1704 [Leptomonas seymouri]|eukprot:KPI89211.1 hypothetical protein ABL78_1704 [Leptomonas seymouri]
MAYLSLPPSSAAPSSQLDGGGGYTSGAGLWNPARSFLRCVNAALHGDTPCRRSKESDHSSSHSSTQRCARSGLRSGSVPDSQPASGVPSLSTREGHSINRDAHTEGRYAPSSTRLFATAQTPALPVRSGTSGAAPVPKAAGSAHVVAASDAELHRRAVDFSDVEEVLRCPLPPVKGCPTPCTYGESLMKGGIPLSPASACSQAGASPASPLTFRCIGADADTGITIYSAPVENCPMHLMRAYAVLPCAPRDVLRYMHNDVRPLWDSYIRRNAMLRELPPPEVAAEAAKAYPLSSSIGAAVTGVGRQSPTSLSARTKPLRTASASTSTAATSPPAASDKFDYRPGQRRVAIHYLETRSPVPFVQDRDFELVVAEEVRPDGVACSKAFSTPFGYDMPLDPEQSRYVRAVVLLSGFVARPLDAAVVDQVLPPMLRRHRALLAKQPSPKRNLKTAQGTHLEAQPPSLPQLLPEYCVLEYIGLVHPMGMLPAVLVNIVISAQLNAMRKMQSFIARNPILTLWPRVSGSSSSSQVGRSALQATVPPLKELSAALRASPSDAPPSASTPEHPGGQNEGETRVSAASSAVADAPVSTAGDLASRSTDVLDADSKGKPKAARRDAHEAAEQQQRKAEKSWWRWRPGQLLSRL